MASLQKSVETDAVATDDPWDWSVDQVVVALCDQKGPFLTSINPISLPDPAFLEDALRANVVGGPTLLTSLTSATLREELGIKPLGHRTTILHLIRAWQRQSPKYAQHVQLDPQLSYISGHEEVLRHFTDPKSVIPYLGLPLQHVRSTYYSAPGAVQPSGLPLGATQQLPQTPLSNDENWSIFQQRALSLEGQRPPHGLGLLTSEKLSLDGVHPIEESIAINERDDIGQSAVANEQNKNGELVPHPDQGNHDADLTSKPVSPTVANKRQGEVCIIDKDGRKRRRLVLAVPAPSQDTGGAQETSTNAEEPDVTLAPSEPFEGSSVRPSEGPEETPMEDGHVHATGVAVRAPLQEDYPAGNLFIDNQGRKRMKPVLIWPRNHELTPETLHPLPTTLPVLSKASPEFQHGKNLDGRTPKESYLGIRSLAVDKLFYGHSMIGQEIQNEVIYGDTWQLSETKESEFFYFFDNPFGCGQRQYVGNRIQHYLFSHRSRAFSYRGQKTITPYQNSLVKKNHIVSATIFRKSSHGIDAIRVDRSKWLDDKSSLFQIQASGADVWGKSDKFQTKIDEVDTSWDYLEKWKHKASEDEILPIYGDSGSEGRYDSETWQEIEDEEGKAIRAERRLDRPQKMGATLSTLQLDETIKIAIDQIMEQWHLVNESRLQRQAYNFWMKSRKKGDWDLQRASLSKRIKILKKRLIRMVAEIQSNDWSNMKQIHKQCKILQPSLYDLEECKWKLSILKLETSPEKTPLEPRGRVQGRISDLPLSDTPDNGKSRASDFESSGDDLGDFITDDDSETGFFPAADENDPSVSDSEDEASLFKAPDTGHPSSMELGSQDCNQDEIKTENMKAQAIGQKIEESVTAASLSPRRLAERVPNQLDIIDLTKIPESSEEDKTGGLPDALSNGGTPWLSLTDDENPFRRDRKSLVAFKNPPIISEEPPLISLDSDSHSDSKENEDALPLSQASLPGFREVNKIRRIDASLLVERKDRKRLLIWTIAHTHPSRRHEVAQYVDQSRSYDAQSLVWAGLNAYKFSELRIEGLEKEESDTLMRIAAWYVCWTIPVKVSAKPPGVKATHIATALADIKGFQVFYTFLGECLSHYKTENNNALTPTPPKKRALLEDFKDSPNPTPTRKQRKYAVPESQETKDLRLNAQKRVRERDKRQEHLKERLQPMGVNEDHYQVIVNVGKHDDQEFIYLNPKIGDRIQLHQKEGVQFMWREVVAGHQGCLLAQTMGLGKTMQVIALLVTIAEASKSSNENIRNQVPESLRECRTLILCPVALVENWLDELLLWTPSPRTKNIGELHKVTVALNLKERIWEIETWKNQGGVLIIGFNTFRDLIQNKPRQNRAKPLDDEQHNMVKSALLDLPNIIVADEAHAAKTITSGINRCMKQLRSVSRIALTGSPLANNLEEYHSLIDWIAPNYLGTSVEFKANYEERIREGLWQDSTAIQYRDSLKWLEVLKKELEPKVHRADISTLAGRLKEKQEFVIRVPLTPIQEEIYRICVDIMALVVDQTDQKPPTLWALLSLLRLLCNHPKCYRDKLLARAVPGSKGKVNKKASKKAFLDDSAVVDEANAFIDVSVSEIGMSEAMIEKQLAPFNNLTDPIESVSLSNKMLIFQAILQFSREAQDKILVFSHTLDTLNYIEDLLKKAHARYSRIDGKVKPIDRQQVTKDFNNGNLEVCIISTRAGGQGLNLYGANRVVIMDDHYNPMYEEQAVGRAYRMGQKKAVFVYHLMVGGTFEEVLHNQSVFKQQLAKRVVDKKNPARRALRGISEYLQSPVPLKQQNLGEFYGNDKLVLDRILALQDKNPIIRSMDFTETFHQEDPITLTLEEKREAAQLQKDEHLRRSDPVAYELQMRHRRLDQRRAIDEHISTTRAQQMEPHVGPRPDPHEAFLNFQTTTMHSPPPAHYTIPQPSTIDPIVGVESTTPALPRDPTPIPKSPLSLHLEKDGLPPVQASNIRPQLLATESPEKHTHPSTNGEPTRKASPASPVPSSEASKVFTPFPALQNLLQREAMRMKKRETE